MSSVARRVAVQGVGVLIAALLGVGALTAGALYLQARRSVDVALLAAASQGGVDDGWEAEHVQAPVRTWRVEPDDPTLPADLVARARRAEGPVWSDHGRDRLLLLPFEREGHHREDHGLVAATAPRVTLVGAVGPFAVLYALAAAVGAAVAAIVLQVGVRRAFAPIRDARAAAAALGATGQRLPEGGPSEIAGLIHAINEALERRDAAFAAQGRFTAEAAHELRTPVATMLGELDVALRRDRDAASYREVLTSSREEVLRLRRLVDGLTVLSRLDAGHAEGSREPVRARELAEAVMSSEGGALRRSGVGLALIVTRDQELEVNRGLAEVALGNLVRNVARHAPGARATLTVDGPRFVVDDAGPGVPASDREVLLDRFARRPEARTGDGLGLGLSLAAEIARRHGGRCWLDASPFGGLRAVLVLAPDTEEESG